MPPDRTAGRPRRRADAERSVARIEEAAIDAIAADPDVSMAEIARRAGVVRATIYVHFPTRESLIDAITERALAEAAQHVAAAGPDRGDAADALGRVVAAAWGALGRFHALVAINVRLPPAELRRRHEALMALLEPLVERGQRDGTFRADVPPGWHLSMVLALVHAASAEVRAGRAKPDAAEAALVATVVGALSAPD
jgi:AcrR family transcriptional regulator